MYIYTIHGIQYEFRVRYTLAQLDGTVQQIARCASSVISVHRVLSRSGLIVTSGKIYLSANLT